jgi:hypothetical protein
MTQQEEKPGRTVHAPVGSKKTNEDAGRSLAKTPAPETDFGAVAQVPMNITAVPAALTSGPGLVQAPERKTAASTMITAQDADSLRPEVRFKPDRPVDDPSQRASGVPELAKRQGPTEGIRPIATDHGKPDVLAKGERPALPTKSEDEAHPAEAANGVDPLASFGALKGKTDARPVVVADIAAGGSKPPDAVAVPAKRGIPTKVVDSLNSVEGQPVGVADSSARTGAGAADLSAQPAVHAGNVKMAHASNANQKQNWKTVRHNQVDGPDRGSAPPMDAGNDLAGTASPRDLGASSSAGVREESQQTTPHAAPASPREPFAALDRATPAPPTTWLHAGTHRAEAGYLDPALGWVGVRADAVGSGLHAALMPGSTHAAEVLGSHLAGLNAHLSAHHGPSATVTITGFEHGQGGGGIDPGDHSQPGRDEKETAPESREDLTAEPKAVDRPQTLPEAAGMSALGEDARYISVIV